MGEGRTTVPDKIVQGVKEEGRKGYTVKKTKSNEDMWIASVGTMLKVTEAREIL